MQYDEKTHIKKLKKMLCMKEPCRYCPGSFLPNPISSEHVLYKDKCIACTEFIGIIINKRISKLHTRKKCPCYILGKEEAIKRTWLKLEEMLDEKDPFFNNEILDSSSIIF